MDGQRVLAGQGGMSLNRKRMAGRFDQALQFTRGSRAFWRFTADNRILALLPLIENGLGHLSLSRSIEETPC